MYVVISLGQRPRKEKEKERMRKKETGGGGGSEAKQEIVRRLRGKRAVTLGYDCDPHLGRATSSYIET